MLPLEIVKHILSFDKRFVIRKNGKIVYINKLLLNDKRYSILRNISLIKREPYTNISYLILNICYRKEYYIIYHNNCYVINVMYYDEDSVFPISQYVRFFENKFIQYII